MATLAQAETILVRRGTIRLLTFVGFATTKAGSSAPNDDLADPIVEGLRSVGIFPSDPTGASDTEMGMVSDAMLKQFSDVAELRLKMNMLASATSVVTQQVEMNRREFGQTIKALETEVARLNADIIQKYYAGTSRVEIGPLYGSGSIHGGVCVPPWLLPCC